MNINFADVEGGFETIPEGPYPIVVEKAEVRESKSSDNNYLNWEMTITDGEYEGRKLWMITSFSPKALFRLKDVFEALDLLEDEMDLEWDEDVEITQQSGPMLLDPDVNGATGVALVGIDFDFDPKGRNKVDTIVGFDDVAARGVGDAGDKKSSGKPQRAGSGNAKSGSQRRALR